MTLLALLLLGQLQGVGLSQNDGGEKYVRHLNCTGSGITCSSSSTFGTINVTGGGSGITVPTCSGGQATTANGSSFSCVSNVSTATALAANPTDCSANQYATTIAANGNLTCSQVSYSQLSGSPLAGGSSPQVQYNNGGVLGGVSNVTSDGTREIYAAETSFPSAPASGDVAVSFGQSANIPSIPATVGNRWGLAIPVGLMGSQEWNFGPAGGNWFVKTARVQDFNASAITVTNQSSPTVAGTQNGTTWKIDAGFIPRQPCDRVGANTTANYAAAQITGSAFCWPGLAAWSSTGGGCLFQSRFFIDASIGSGQPTDGGAAPKAQYFEGLASGTSAINAAVVNPSTITNTFYVGCDNAGATLNVCSNDATGSATCTDLGANFPTHVANAAYDVTLFIPPGGAGTYHYDVERLDVPASATGDISSDLPLGTIQMTWHSWCNNGDGGIDCGVGWCSTTLVTNY